MKRGARASWCSRWFLSFIGIALLAVLVVVLRAVPAAGWRTGRSAAPSVIAADVR